MPNLRSWYPWLFLFLALGLFLLNVASLLHLQQPEGIFSESRIWSMQSRQLTSHEDMMVHNIQRNAMGQIENDSMVQKSGEDFLNRPKKLTERVPNQTETATEQPLIYLGEDPSFRVNESLQNTHQLTATSRGRLGNLMFVYASLLGISQKNYFKPAFPEGNLLWETFELSAKPIGSQPMQRWPKLVEAAPMAYDYRTEMLNYEMDIELVGYYQSWKYFKEIENGIRNEFTFKKKLSEFAINFVDDAILENFPESSEHEEVVVVGVHVRRGDLLEEGNELRGYNFADSSYILSAMTYFEAQYEGRLLFVIASDDIEWCRDHLYSDLTPVVFSEGHKDREDLALLAHCDHVIMTVGTFGWWAAWLSGGTVIYYKDSIAEGSIIDDEGFEPGDYFCPTWIGL